MSNRPTLAGCRKAVTTFLINGHVETKYNSFHTLGIAHIRRSIVKAKGNRLQSFSSDAGLPKGSTAVQANHYWSKTCGCCGLNTKGKKSASVFRRHCFIIITALQQHDFPGRKLVQGPSQLQLARASVSSQRRQYLLLMNNYMLRTFKLSKKL